MLSPDDISTIPKRNFERAVDAIKRDDVDELKDILNVLPEFNTMVDEQDRNLLYFSWMFERKKVFDYLLELNCFDLETVDQFEGTILEQALRYSMDDYFAVKLIKVGADVFRICEGFEEGGYTYFHYTIRYGLFDIAKLLLQKGLDPNAQDHYGNTPLHLFTQYSYSLERLDWLLQHGADTAIRNNHGYLPFDCAVLFRKDFSIQEHLFHCTFDSHSANKIQSEAWIKLLDSPLFDNVMDIVSGVFSELERIPVIFFVIQPDMLKKIIEKCDYILEEVFSREEPPRDMTMNIDNIEILLNSKLHTEIVQLISRLKLKQIFCANHKRMSKEELSNLILYLLSYGLNVTSYDCQYIYSTQGYSDFFKTMLLHLDYTETSKYEAPMANIIIDIHSDLDTIISNFSYFTSHKITLLHFFANDKLRRRFGRSFKSRFAKRVEQVPKLPTLLQLARDETRRHIIKRYKLQTTSQYYWVLRKMGIATAHEKILSFETRLYE